jgi:hypothetical protein
VHIFCSSWLHVLEKTVSTLYSTGALHKFGSGEETVDVTTWPRVVLEKAKGKFAHMIFKGQNIGKNRDKQVKNHNQLNSLSIFCLIAIK